MRANTVASEIAAERNASGGTPFTERTEAQQFAAFKMFPYLRELHPELYAKLVKV